MTAKLVLPTQLSANEVVYNLAGGLTGAIGYAPDAAERTGAKPIIAKISVGDLTAGATGAAKVLEFGFVTNSASLGSTGSFIRCTDKQTGAGLTGSSFSAEEVIGRNFKLVELNPADFQAQIYGYAKGLTGSPAVCIEII